MTDDVTRRPWWRWMAGMADLDGVRVCGTDGPWAMVTSGQHGADVYMVLASTLRPDSTDPATLGCLLALARELWVDCWLWLDVDTLGIMRRVRVWRGTGYPVGTVATGDTEWSALVAACDAAWGRR